MRGFACGRDPHRSGSEDHHLFQYLTQEEWKLVFALAFLANSDTFEGCYDLKRYATPEAECTWEELFRRGIRFLALGHGFDFQGVRVHQGGEISLVRRVQPENQIYAVNARAGRLPGNPLYALATAIEMAQQFLPDLDVSHMRAAMAQIEKDLAETRAQWKPEQIQQMYEERKTALESIGVRPIREVVH